MGRKGKRNCAASVIVSMLIIGAIDASDLPDRRTLPVGVFSTHERNPATLGFDRIAKNELTVPIFPEIKVGWWSNRLALTPYVDMTDAGKLDDYINVILDRSFNTAGLDAGQASKKIMDDVADGVSVYARTRTTALALTTKFGSLAIHSSIDAQVNLPRGLFALVFGDDQGLVSGNRIDFKELKAEAVAYSTISAAYGRQFPTPLLQQFVKRLSYGFFDCTKASWGLGIDYVVGHAFVREKTLDGSIKVTKRNGIDAVEINSQVEVITAGGGVHGKWNIPQSTRMKNFFPGSGIGMNAGIALVGPKTTLDLSLDGIGFIRWGHVKKVVYTVRDTSVRLFRLLNDSIVQTRPGPGDTLKDSPAFFQSLPMRISLATGYTFHFENKARDFRVFSQHVVVALRCDQNCAPWPSYNYIPRIELGAENGALFGVVPIQCGFFAGGSEGIGSILGVGLNTRLIKIDVGYTAFGTPYFSPKRGMALSMSIRGNW